MKNCFTTLGKPYNDIERLMLSKNLIMKPNDPTVHLVDTHDKNINLCAGDQIMLILFCTDISYSVETAYDIEFTIE